jgi:hypothetical protein
MACTALGIPSMGAMAIYQPLAYSGGTHSLAKIVMAWESAVLTVNPSIRSLLTAYAGRLPLRRYASRLRGIVDYQDE